MNLKTSRLTRMLPAVLAGLMTGFAAVPSASAQPVYSVTDLGALPGYSISIPENLNDRGDVVGYCTTAAGGMNLVAFVWRAGVMSPVGKLPNGVWSMATAIDSNGAIAGQGDTGDLRPQGWVTTAKGLVNFFPTSGNVAVMFLTDTGAIGGAYTKGGNGGFIPAIWTVDPKDPRKYRTANLPILPSGINATLSFAVVSAFNKSGQAVGRSTNDQTGAGYTAVLWNSDSAHTVVDLGALPGDVSSLALGMNDIGQAVGASHPILFGEVPVLWNNDPLHTPVALPTLPGDNNGAAVAINNAGDVVGWSHSQAPSSVGSTFDYTPLRMVVWHGGDVFELQSVLDPLTGAGVTLDAPALITGAAALPIKINNAGQILVYGERDGGARHALLLTPIAQ